MSASIRWSCLSACALAALVLSAGTTSAADKIKNPEYEGWAACKTGATTRIEGTTEAGGQKSKQTITTKLVELTPEKAVVESSISMEVMGQKMDQPAQKRDVPAMIDDPKTTAPADASGKKPEIKEGEDTVTVAGKRYKCKTMEITAEQNGMKNVSKVWHTPEVPGGTLKIESQTSGTVEAKMTMGLVEFSDGK